MRQSGKLRIGDHSNAITIIALSQSNPLKAIAEFVENSIDAKAKNITIIRGKEKGTPYLIVRDDGEGIPLNEEGNPDFRYVATHVCDSIKRRLRAEGKGGIQGEFGIGLLSFWTIGEELFLTSPGTDKKVHQMHMRKGETRYHIESSRKLFGESGCELKVTPLLPGIRYFSGEKIQWYLASELRDRIRLSGVTIKILDRQARKQFRVEPRQYGGELLHRLPDCKTKQGECYLEIYLTSPDPENGIGLYRSGTRVLKKITELDCFQKEPWTSGCFEGILDVPSLNLTPGTRLGVIQDQAFADFCQAIVPIEESLQEVIAERKRAEEEKTSKEVLHSIQRALQEALLLLPEEEYDWFDLTGRAGRILRRRGSNGFQTEEVSSEGVDGGEMIQKENPSTETKGQKTFFEMPGPLRTVKISPASSVVPVGKIKNFRAICRDRKGVLVESGIVFAWQILEGEGGLDKQDEETATFQAPMEPALIRIGVTVTQREIACTAEARITVTESILPKTSGNADNKGLPGYTFQKAPGELWRSRYQPEQNVIVINNAHRDFVFASKTKALQLRYISRLFSKELVHKNFPGLPPNELLERMIELSMYTEENL